MDLFARKGRTIAITDMGVKEAEKWEGGGGQRKLILYRLKEDSPTTAKDIAKKMNMDTGTIEAVLADLVDAGYAYYVTRKT